MSIDLSKKNIGGTDRKLRVAGGTLLLTVGYFTKNRMLKCAGYAFLTTGLLEKCVFYDLLNINTYKES